MPLAEPQILDALSALSDGTRCRMIRLLDAPVSGGEAGAKAASLSIMVGGAAADFEAAAEVFDAVEQDPSRETLMAAVAAGQGCASVVGFGGGSPMDVAKLAAYLLGSGDELDSIWGVGKAVGTRLPLALVPTTAGTGSEATSVSVITVGVGTCDGAS